MLKNPEVILNNPEVILSAAKDLLLRLSLKITQEQHAHKHNSPARDGIGKPRTAVLGTRKKQVRVL